MDYGYVHWNMVYLFGRDDDGNIYVIDEVANRRDMPETIAPDITEMLNRHNVKKNKIEQFVAGGDVFSERGGEKTVAAKYEEKGFSLQRANMNRISGAMEIATRLGDPVHGKTATLFISDRCEKLIGVIPEMQHNPNRPEDVLKVNADDDGDGGDDPYDAFRYGVMAAQSSGGAGVSYSYT